MAGKACLCPPRHPPLTLLLLSHAVLSDVWSTLAGGVRQVGAGLGPETDPECLQPSASILGPPEAQHDAGGGTAEGRAGMAAQEQP